MKQLQVEFLSSSKNFANQALVVLVQDKTNLDLSMVTDSAAAAIQAAYSSLLASSKFKAKEGSSAVLHGIVDKASLIFVGLGKAKTETIAQWTELGGKIAKAAARQKYSHLTILCPSTLAAKTEEAAKRAEIVAQLALGVTLGNYRFDRYLTTKKSKLHVPTLLKQLTLVGGEATPEAQAIFNKQLLPVANGVLTARNLGNEPTNKMTTQDMLEACLALEHPKLKIKVLGEAELQALRMNSLLAVGQGSDQESFAVFMSWQGKGGKDTDLAVLGKGVVFDTGGISLKPSRKMEEMKFDMCGAAAVIGLMRTLIERDAPVNVVGAVGLVENMPSSKAQRPGDIVTSMSGQTIEVTNTDAEGRMVLADLITCTQQHYKPKQMVDMATLTGSVVVALGSKFAGLFTNSDKLQKQLEKASKTVNEKLWNMPMDKVFDEAMDSKVADVINAEAGYEAGSVTAAKFLERFVDDEVEWAHLDIAGTATTEKPNALNTLGATGFGVRLLNQLIISNFEL